MLQPQQRERQAAFDGVLRLFVTNGQKGAAYGPFREIPRAYNPDSECPRSDAMEIFRPFRPGGSPRDATELAAKILSRYHFGAAFVTQADDFHSLGSASAKAFDGEHDSVRRLIRDATDASRYAAVLRPQAQERLVYCAAYFSGHRGLRGGQAAAFADFDGAGGKEILQAGAQLFGEFSYQYHKLTI
jgi:hypothetical protein